jgi:DNA-binding PadR family transcriptional regulator
VGDKAPLPIPEGSLPLTPAVLEIMVALGNQERHGYAIMRELRRRTDGVRPLSPATLYRSLKQMEQRGWVAHSEERPKGGIDDERRRYYRLTEYGRRVVLAEVERLEGMVGAARSKGLIPSGGTMGADA